MCIRCNVPDTPGHADAAGAFLDAFAVSRDAMRRAADSMSAVLATDLDPAVRQRYDRAHKAMRRQMREWNAIEELREAPVEAATPR